MNNHVDNKNIQIGGSLLFVTGAVFLMLKLSGAINWDWWIVLIPFYPAFIAIILLMLILICVGLAIFTKMIR